MKNIFLVLGLLVSFYTYSQSTVKTETFVVKGNCDDCKERIENAADIKGVKISNWNVDKKIISVTYDSKKTDITKIQKAIAAKGYDAGDVKGDAAAYKKLPLCCQYNDRTHEEGKK
ncbi:MAG: heavy-metal-associated domain-containing protein [Sphingobacteriaceae bacterium]|nr:heavy-metal-associated domain-containing protein [Sphingobacteriaceae bacterium]